MTNTLYFYRKYSLLLIAFLLCLTTQAQKREAQKMTKVLANGSVITYSLRACNNPLEEDQRYDGVYHTKAGDSHYSVVDSYWETDSLAYGDTLFRIAAHVAAEFATKQKDYNELRLNICAYPPNRFYGTGIIDGWNHDMTAGVVLVANGKCEGKKGCTLSLHGRKAKAEGYILLETFPNVPDGYDLFLHYKLRYDPDNLQSSWIACKPKLQKKNK